MSATKHTTIRKLGHAMMYMKYKQRVREYLDLAAHLLGEPLGSPQHKLGDVETSLQWALRMEHAATRHAHSALATGTKTDGTNRRERIH